MILTLCGSGRAYAQDTPAITRPVTDLAGVLSDGDEEAIGERLERYRASNEVQIAVLLVQTTAGEPIEDYAHRVATLWGGGAKKRDDGVLFVLAVADRRMRLEVGYGLEPFIPDGAAAAILERVKPHLRRLDYAAAVTAVIDGVIGRHSAGPARERGAREPRSEAPVGERGPSGAPRGRAPDRPAAPPRPFGWVAFPYAGCLGLGGLAGGAFGWALGRRRRRSLDPDEQPPPPSALAGLAFMAPLAGIAASIGLCLALGRPLDFLAATAVGLAVATAFVRGAGSASSTMLRPFAVGFVLGFGLVGIAILAGLTNEAEPFPLALGHFAVSVLVGALGAFAAVVNASDGGASSTYGGSSWSSSPSSRSWESSSFGPTKSSGSSFDGSSFGGSRSSGSSFGGSRSSGSSSSSSRWKGGGGSFGGGGASASW